MESGSITAAIIFGAIISIITLIVGRGSKISELRQAWINDQRTDFAAFGAAALSLAAQRSKDRAEDFDKLETAAYRIRLRENPRKKEWAAVIAHMDAIRTELIANETTKIDVLPTLFTIGELAQDRLKRDWNKIRFGEPGYRWLLVLLAALVGALSWMGYHALTDPARGAKPGGQHVAGQAQSATRSATDRGEHQVPARPTTPSTGTRKARPVALGDEPSRGEQQQKP